MALIKRGFLALFTYPKLRGMGGGGGWTYAEDNIFGEKEE